MRPASVSFIVCSCVYPAGAHCPGPYGSVNNCSGSTLTALPYNKNTCHPEQFSVSTVFQPNSIIIRKCQQHQNLSRHLCQAHFSHSADNSCREPKTVFRSSDMSNAIRYSSCYLARILNLNHFIIAINDVHLYSPEHWSTEANNAPSISATTEANTTSLSSRNTF